MRLIDADKIPYLHVDGFGVTSYAHRADIEKMPTIDPVHEAGGCYCRECRHKDIAACPAYDAPMGRTSLRIKHCSEGEVREMRDDVGTDI